MGQRYSLVEDSLLDKFTAPQHYNEFTHFNQASIGLNFYFFNSFLVLGIRASFALLFIFMPLGATILEVSL